MELRNGAKASLGMEYSLRVHGPAQALLWGRGGAGSLTSHWSLPRQASAPRPLLPRVSMWALAHHIPGDKGHPAGGTWTT